MGARYRDDVPPPPLGISAATSIDNGDFAKRYNYDEKRSGSVESRSGMRPTPAEISKDATDPVIGRGSMCLDRINWMLQKKESLASGFQITYSRPRHRHKPVITFEQGNSRYCLLRAQNVIA